MGKVVNATLIKLKTDDGLVEFHPDVPLGKVYKIDLSLVKTMEMYNHVKNVSHMKEMVWDMRGGWLPTEVLSWEGKGGDQP